MVVVSVTQEIALDDFPVYSGGLGVLEGDKFYAMARMGVEYLVVTQFHPKGYVVYEVEGDELVPHPQQIRPEELSDVLVAEEELRVSSRTWGTIRVVPYVHAKGTAKAVFLHVVEPETAARAVERLYVRETGEDGDWAPLIFALAAASYIRERVGIERVEVLDLQESFGALVLELLPELKGRARLIVHTPAPWADTRPRADIVSSELGIPLAGERVSLLKFAWDRAAEVIAVSRRHEQVIRSSWSIDGGKLRHVTNGIDLNRWTHPEIARRLKINGSISRQELAEVRRLVRSELLRLLRSAKPHARFGEGFMIVAWARRITRYKRPHFVERLIADLGGGRDVVFVLAGKAHPFDGEGRRHMREFMRLHRETENVVYIHDYDLVKARLILSGSDLLLFTPFPGWEACGTSYMKAGANGVPTLSSRDGGALELIADGQNGWFFGSEHTRLMDIYEDPETEAIDRRDYDDFLRRFIEIERTFRDSPEEYLEVQHNAFLTFRDRCRIERALRKYYPEHLDGKVWGGTD